MGLYYYLNFTMAMQIIEEQAVYIKVDNGRDICLMNTGLHKDGHVLYAVIVPNTIIMTKQSWQIIDYTHISEAFMTADQLKRTDRIYSIDLPKSSRQIHNNWQEDKNRINILQTEPSKLSATHCIRRTFQGKKRIHIIQSRRNMQNGRRVSMSRDQFAHYAITSLKHEFKINRKPICIVHFHLRQRKYEIRKVLPVWLPEERAYVGLIFSFDDTQRIIISGIGLDLIDLKNKANLIEAVPADSWLNSPYTIDALNFDQGPWNRQRNKHPIHQRNGNYQSQNYYSASTGTSSASSNF